MVWCLHFIVFAVIEIRVDYGGVLWNVVCFLNFLLEVFSIGSMCVFSCRCCVLVSVMHPVYSECGALC